MMKQKRLFKTLFVLLLVVLGYTNMQAQGTVAGDAAPYAVLSDNNTVLTFYCDDQKTARNGMDVGPFIASHFRSWDDECQIVTSVVFDASFADCTTLTSTAWWFYDMRNLTTIEGISNLKTDNVTSMREMFRNCELLSNLDVSHFNTSNVTDMRYMFNNCKALTSLDVSQFNTSNVTDMGCMFYDCRSLASLDVSGFNTENVTSMERMFEGCQVLENLDVSGFKTDKVTNMGSMFYRCWSLTSLDVSNFNTANVTNMSEMFGNCLVLPNIDVSGFNTENVTTMHSMFYNCNALSNIDVSNFNTAKVNDMGNMFGYCTSLTNLDVSAFNTANVTDMESMFASCSSLVSLELNTFNTEKLASMKGMFIDCSSLTNLDVSSFNTSNVTDMRRAFSGCSSLNSFDLSSFNTEKVADMRELFNECSSLATIYAGSGWSTTAVTNGNGLFYKCTSLVGGAGTHYDVNHTDYTYARIDGGPNSSIPGYFTQSGEQPWVDPVVPEPYAVLTDNNSILTFYYDEKKTERNGMNIASVGYPSWYDQRESITKVIFDDTFANCTTLTSTSMWFYGCSFLTEIVGISNLKTDNVTDMGLMFRECPKLTALDVSGFNTENVTSMNAMFFGCSSLTSLDVSNFNTSNVTYMGLMFGSCSGLTSLDVTNFNMEKVNVVTEMFEDCTGLKTLDISNFNTGNAFQMESMFIGCSNLETIYVDSNWSLHPNTEGHFMFEGCTSLVGGKGTVFDFDHRDQEYARIDGGPNSTTPGYFTDKNAIVEYALDAEVVAIASGHISISSVMDTEGMWSESYHYKLTINPDNNPKVVANAVASPASLDYFQFNWYGGYLFVGNYTGVSANIDAGVLKSNFQKLTITPTNIENLVDGATYTFKLTAYETVQNTEVARRETTISLTKLMPTEANLLTFRPNQETTDGSGEVISYMTPNKQGTIANAYAPFADNNFAPSQTTAEIEACYDARDAKASNGFKNLSNIFYNLSVNGQNGYNSGTYDENEWDKTFEFMFGTSNADGTSALVDANGKGISFAHPQGLQTSQKYMLEIPAELIDGTTKHTLDIYKVYPGISTELNNDGSVHHFNEDYPVANGQHLNFTYACWHHANTFAWESPDKTPQLQWSSAGSEGTAPFTDIVSMNTYDPDYFGNGTATGKTLANLTAKYFLTGFDNVQLNSMADGTGQINSYYIPSIDGETITFTQASTQAAAAPDADHTEYLIITAKDAFNHDVRIVLDVQIKVPVVTDPEPYAALSDNNTVLTFYYDEHKEERNGMSVGPFNDSDKQSWYNQRESITTAVFDESFANCTSLTSTFLWFYGCRNMVSISGIQYLKTDNVTDMSRMFDSCSSLTSLDVSGFNTENVTHMYDMFYMCSSLTSIDVSHFNTSNVKRMSWMFNGCKNLTSLDVSNFKTDNVTDMNSMFLGCSGLTSLDLSVFNTANVTDMYAMFSGCSGLTTLDVSNFNTANVTHMSYMFNRCSGLTSLDVTNFKTDNVTDMATMFSNCSNLTSLDLSNFNTANVTNMSAMFHYCENLSHLNLSSFNTVNVTDMSTMFLYCSALKDLDLSNFNTSNVTNLHGMFHGCISLTELDLSSFNTANVTAMDDMFSYCYKLTTVYASDRWSTASVTEGNEMFSECIDLVGGAGTHFSPDHVDYTYARIDGGPNSQTPGYFTDKNAPIVTDTEPYAVLSDNNTVLTFYYDEHKEERNGMSVGPFGIESDRGWNDYCENITTAIFDGSFANCTSLTSTRLWFTGCQNLTAIQDLSNLKTDNVTDMRYMFKSCSSLTSLDVSGFKTDNVTNMGDMFFGCSKLTTLDLSNFNTSQVKYMYYMFSFCSELTSLDVSNFNTENVESMVMMFEDCSSLTSLNVSSFKTENVTKMGNMFNGCSGLTSLDVSNFNTSNVTDMSQMFSGCSSLTSLDVSNFNTSNVTSMNGMFSSCAGLTSLDVSNFNTSIVMNMYAMFSGCSGLKTVYVGDGWTTASVTEGAQMFAGCTNLVGGKGTHYDPDHVDFTYARIDGGPNSQTPGYFTDKNAPVVTDPEPYAVLSENNTLLTFYYDEHKEERNGMSVGPFTLDDRKVNSGWDEQRDNITSVVFDESFANCATLTSTSCWFYGFTNLTSIVGLSNLKTDNVTDMSRMFSRSTSLTSVDFGNLNTENVTNLSRMFHDCTGLVSINVSSFNTANVTLINGMFDGCSSLTTVDVSGFDTSKATDMGEMFYGCSSLKNLDLRNFNTANATRMHEMFNGCSGLINLNVSSFNTANVTDMGIMFGKCSSLTNLDLSSFNTSNVTRMQRMFENDTLLTSIYVGEEWSTANVTSGYEVFTGSTNLVGGKGTHYDPNHIDYTYARIDGGPDSETPGYFTRKGDAPWVEPGTPEPYAVLSDNNNVLTFYYDTEREQRNGMSVGPFEGMSGWYNQRENITNVVFDASFANCTTLTSTAEWFYGFKNLTSITGISNLKTDNVTDMTFMFNSCSSLTDLDVSGFKTNKVTTMEGMFCGCSSLTSLDLSSFNTENVTNMEMMFQSCSKLKELNISSFNTSKVTSFFQMFIDCYSLESLDVSSFDTKSATIMRWMFGYCSGLTSLDVSNFNTSNVRDFGEMFNGCSNLESLDVSNFNTQSAQNMWLMFARCHKLTSLDVSNFKTDNVVYMDKMFSGCSGMTYINLSNINTANVMSMEGMFSGCSSLAAIQAGSAAIPDSIYALVENPNLLVYVNEARLAPEGVQNVVVNGVAKEIVLKDAEGNNNWYCPEPFRAEKVSYTREFRQQTQIGISRGWESLALPFAVQTITHQDKGAIAPFGSDASGLHFWLRRLGREGLTSVQRIEANTPYVISMPNSEDYPERFNLNGRVTFAAEDVTVPATATMVDNIVETDELALIPAFQRMAVSEDFYALNVGEERNGRPEGSIFERNYRQVRPFEAYTLHRGDRPAPQFFDLSDLEGSTTDVPDVRWMMDDGNGEWYDLQGRKLGSTLNVQRSTLKKGVYIHNGRKTVVR